MTAKLPCCISIPYPSFQLKMLVLQIQNPLVRQHYHIKQRQGFGKLTAAGTISEDHLLVWKMECLSLLRVKLFNITSQNRLNHVKKKRKHIAGMRARSLTTKYNPIKYNQDNTSYIYTSIGE